MLIPIGMMLLLLLLLLLLLSLQFRGVFALEVSAAGGGDAISDRAAAAVFTAFEHEALMRFHVTVAFAGVRVAARISINKAGV